MKLLEFLWDNNGNVYEKNHNGYCVCRNNVSNDCM